MITIVNTTGRTLQDHNNLIVNSFPFFKEVMVTITPEQVKDAFKEITVSVIIVKDRALAIKAHVDNPDADIYVLAKNSYCVTLAFKGLNGIKEEVEQVSAYSLCPSEMINFK